MAPVDSALRKQVDEPARIFVRSAHIESEQALLAPSWSTTKPSTGFRFPQSGTLLRANSPENIPAYARPDFAPARWRTPVTLKTFIGADVDIGGMTVSQSCAARGRSDHHHPIA